MVWVSDPHMRIQDPFGKSPALLVLDFGRVLSRETFRGGRDGPPDNSSIFH